MYERALRIDPNDVEANFNSGLLYLQYSSELETALRFFMASVQRDAPNDRRSEMFRAQFSKAYYNIGMIYDKMGKTQEACDSYKKSLKKCEEDPQKKLTLTATYKKAGTNFAVALEKLGERQEAVKML